MVAFYNDTDQFAAAWLLELIRAGQIRPGKIDTRSITEVSANDVRNFERVHFFAGIGGWDYALKLAGWEGPVWTGSCPCQPFSCAGKRQGTADERHLWPEFLRLIAECRPPTIFGEQVASRDGREWLAGVRADLEALGYAVGAADLCAAGEGAPHIRQRLFWVGDTNSQRQQGFDALLQSGGSQQDRSKAPWASATGRLGDAASEQMGRARQPWQDGVWLPCLDGKARRIEPGTFPLAHGVPARVGRLRGYGNAIVPQVAAQFIQAFMTA